MAITIKDIARLANVSTTTVSRVINNKSEGVSEETREKIIELIEEHGFQPNALARGLVTKKTKSIGLIIPDISNPFFPDLARGVEDIANKDGYNIFLCNTDDDPEKEMKYINALKEKQVDGVIFTSSTVPNQGHVVELIKSSIPVVIIDRKVDFDDTFGVFLNNYEGGYAATKHLVELGHTNIACIAGPIYTKESTERLEGYRSALKEAGIEYNEDYVVFSDYKFNGGADASKRLLQNKNITAIFSCNDVMAYGVYDTIKSLGLKIPEDISVVGFDDIKLSQILDPQLTTIRQPIYDMGAEAAKIMIKRIGGKKIRKKVIYFNTDLIIRGSTKSIKLSNCKEGKNE